MPVAVGPDGVALGFPEDRKPEMQFLVVFSFLFFARLLHLTDAFWMIKDGE